MTEDRYWEERIPHYDNCFNALPWFAENIATKFEHNIVSKIQSLYKAYFDKSTGPNIIEDDLIEDLNHSFYKHDFVTSKAFNEEGFCITEVLGIIAEQVSQECELNENERDFVVDVCNAIMIAFGKSRIDTLLAQIESFNEPKSTKKAHEIVNKVDLKSQLKGNWCHNDKVNVLLNILRENIKKLDKIFIELLKDTV